MKIPRIRVIETMLVCSAGALVVLAGAVLYPTVSPPILAFTSFEVVDAPPVVIAGAKRRPADGCTNGPQAEIRDRKGVVTRLPVPARSVSGNTSIYPLVIPAGLASGRYAVKVRESFLCPGRDPQIIESPWLPLEVR